MDERQVDALAHLVLAATIEAALVVARSPDRAEARAAAEQALLALLAGPARATNQVEQ